ncbi:thiolase domain-containing protein [Candidatus Peribacteria bacterium]|nr:thiolase domain-containing protein [Candidatus Peribacteria bacterium]
MNADVFLVGSGQTRFGEWWDKSLPALIEEAVSAAITDAGITALDIDAIVIGNMIGQQISGQGQLGAMTSALLPHRPPALRVEAACASGSVAVHTACALLESKRAETVLVVGAEKMTDAENTAIASALMGAGDSERDAPAGLTFPGIFGLIASRYMHDYGLTREELSLVSSRHHEHAKANPYAQFRSSVSPESVSSSAPVADPLRLLDCSPISDGAAAIILSRTRKSPLRLAASQLATDALSLAERPTITSFAATRDAFCRACEEAEIDRKEIAHLELHDCFSIAALINLEDMQFADPGQGIGIYRDGLQEMSVNLSGGLKGCGHPVGATGVKQIRDLAKQLKASKQRFGAAHNFGGAGATCCVHILEHACEP